MNAQKQAIKIKKVAKRKTNPKDRPIFEAAAKKIANARKDAAINMRARPDQQALLTKAALVLRMDRSVFILDVACKAAENVLLDRRYFQLDDADYDAFVAALDAPIPENEKLRELLAEKAPWQ